MSSWEMPSWEKVARDMEKMFEQIRAIISFSEPLTDEQKIKMIDELLDGEAY